MTNGTADNMTHGLTVAIVAGSHQPQGESGRVAQYIHHHLGAASFVLDLATAGLPEVLAAEQSAWRPWARRLQQASAVVLVCPEYNGMAPPRVLNFLHLCTAQEVGHKPGLLVSVSAGINGVYPIPELRAYGTKNNRLCWIPEHIIIRNVGQMLGGNVSGTHDQNLRDRLAWALEMLLEYASALQHIRASGKTADSRFAHGM